MAASTCSGGSGDAGGAAVDNAAEADDFERVGPARPACGVRFFRGGIRLSPARIPLSVARGPRTPVGSVVSASLWAEVQGRRTAVQRDRARSTRLGSRTLAASTSSSESSILEFRPRRFKVSKVVVLVLELVLISRSPGPSGSVFRCARVGF